MTPDPHHSAARTPEASDELARLVRSWRERLNPDEIPGLQVARSRRRKRVSQEMAAALIGYSVGWLSSLERGERQNYSTDFLDRVAYTLRLSPEEKALLFLLATGHEPPARQRSSSIESTAVVQRLLDAQPWPAYINDEAWDLVAYNHHMLTWFPWVAGHENNVMRWVFTYPEARQQLYRWETDWAPQMLAQMRYAHARAPGNTRLTEVLTEILKDKDAERIWSNPTAYVHPDGDHRSLYLPYHRKVQPIELIALEPLRAPGSRIMMLMPLEGGSD
ncbi:helix-turn-helix transcriptional regulator [Couchioplanes azureus]|uniref:helix-turn-helix transcriptional regulator n=1 Tax=Couchioplanes caeruleus TaxID=56438 RepID=UPI00166F929D|nr:helix-turn-helix transcriptional regulator [Couchioplanes caeruleus]GGQ83879.1 transcriptional regulator [Couchioplanes caeruleus subsp. azureus]